MQLLYQSILFTSKMENQLYGKESFLLNCEHE